MKPRVAGLVFAAVIVASCSSAGPTAGDAATVERGVTYAPGLQADVYLPAGAGPHPAVLLIHGGGFTEGTRQDMDVVAAALQARGMVAATIDYRLSQGQGTWFPATSLDAPALVAAAGVARDDAGVALDWLRDEADRFGLDPGSIVVAGYSAGAITAIEVASHRAGMRGAVSIAGAAVDDAALDAGDAPLVLFHGTDDPVVPFALAEATCAASTAAGGRCSVRPLAGEGHAIVVPHLAEIADEIANLAGTPSG